MNSTNFEKVVLTLRVPSIEKTVVWYESTLGWSGHYDTWDEKGECLFGSVSGHKEPFVGFNLSRLPKDQEPIKDPAYLQIWIYVDGVNAVFEHVRNQGLETITPPENQFWGERIFRMRDVNGFELVFSQAVEHLELEEIRKRHRSQLTGETSAQG
jgi:catechol 2,3-dioxygenase-like lactoylglutathione lyase family enzyme